MIFSTEPPWKIGRSPVAPPLPLQGKILYMPVKKYIVVNYVIDFQNDALWDLKGLTIWSQTFLQYT